MKATLSAAAFLLTLSVASVSAEGDPVEGERAFGKCASCHNIDNPRTRLGPHLMGVVGRRAGSVADYPNYSQAMKDAGASGLVWDEAALREFLSSPKKKVPGTFMRFFGLWSATEIDNIIAYLKTKPAP
ncbi:cytochrome c family protein [uncultured Agrobacterium sp.]|uniref:c-type cytochrome n=1 Tax=uncultured Agrobacterium sp. TaxID=157277 RepID=UPI0025E81324|nr:cytochrome c family protein [uncultured Agrobacterium sp.]